MVVHGAGPSPTTDLKHRFFHLLQACSPHIQPPLSRASALRPRPHRAAPALSAARAHTPLMTATLPVRMRATLPAVSAHGREGDVSGRARQCPEGLKRRRRGRWLAVAGSGWAGWEGFGQRCSARWGKAARYSRLRFCRLLPFLFPQEAGGRLRDAVPSASGSYSRRDGLWGPGAARVSFAGGSRVAAAGLGLLGALSLASRAAAAL